MRLTLLAPDIVEVMLDGKPVPRMSLSWVLRPFPTDWAGQLAHLADRHESRVASIAVHRRVRPGVARRSSGSAHEMAKNFVDRQTMAWRMISDAFPCATILLDGAPFPPHVHC